MLLNNEVSGKHRCTFLTLCFVDISLKKENNGGKCVKIVLLRAIQRSRSQLFLALIKLTLIHATVANQKFVFTLINSDRSVRGIEYLLEHI